MAHERQLGVTADNVANVNTNGFKRARAVLQAGAAGDVRLRVHREDTPTPKDPLAPAVTVAEKSLSNVDLAVEILAIRPDVPIILCTGYSEQISEEKAAALGIKGFAMKPLIMVDLKVLIRRALDG